MCSRCIFSMKLHESFGRFSEAVSAKAKIHKVKLHTCAGMFLPFMISLSRIIQADLICMRDSIEMLRAEHELPGWPSEYELIVLLLPLLY